MMSGLSAQADRAATAPRLEQDWAAVPSALSDPTDRARGGALTKTVTIDVAARLVAAHKACGRSVVLAHGVFDVLHIGHLRHFRLARQEGDVLVVSLTADAFVNKGPGRPVFTQILRAEMLASLDLIDLVVINHAATAIPILEAICPTVYVKGAEYAAEEKDVSGNIVEERLAVERAGGRIAFTNDLVHSSSSLINQFMNIYDPPLRDYLAAFRQKWRLDDVCNAIDSIVDSTVLLVGDTILDEYQYVQPMGKSSKENMIANRFTGRELFAGGVLAAANHVASFCRHVHVVTCIGQDDQETFIRGALKPNVSLHLLRRPSAPTTRKCRFVETGYLRKLFEVYFFDDTPLSEPLQAEVDAVIARLAGENELVISADFGHGLIAPTTIDTLHQHSRFLAVNAQSNSANHGFNLVTKYRKADYVCVDRPELQLAMADRTSSVEALIGRLASHVQSSRVMVTTGKDGCIGFDSTLGFNHAPAFTRSVVDTVGAGDAFLSVTSPLVMRGVPMEIVSLIGNAVGAMKVGIVGHRQAIEKAPLIKYITALLK